MPFPLQAPDQPVNVELAEGVAVRVTDPVPVMEQVLPQFILPPVTVPLPDFVTVRVYEEGTAPTYSYAPIS